MRSAMDAGTGAHILLLTYDSCRYDVLAAARTPVLDSYAQILPAQAPGNYTYASHQSFFAGILPNATADVPLYNRFSKQLVGLVDIGERSVSKDSLLRVESDWNVVRGLSDVGYQTVGAGAMNWFRQRSLTACFERFLFTGRDAEAQIDFLRAELSPDLPFFGFINFGETHAPYTFSGHNTPCSIDVRARCMTWPPSASDGPTGCDSPAFSAQIRAAEFLDARLPRLFRHFPGDTIVVLCGDHGDCFGEDGYWGHGVNHPKVLEVPLAVFRLDHQPLQ